MKGPLLMIFLWLAVCANPALAQPPVVVGSKTFSESHILAEVAAHYLEANGVPVERKIGLGGTLITYEALVQGELDVYPEYTGTLTGAVFDDLSMDIARLGEALDGDGLEFLVPLGFNNSYALAISEALAARLAIASISDLAMHPDLAVGLSLEFLNRGDGWPELQRRYALPQQAKGIEHALAYRALDAGQLDVADAYTTDGDLDLYGLRLLNDDLGVFPAYDAGFLTRKGLPSRARELLADLEGVIDETTMRALNRRVATDGLSPKVVAFDFLVEKALIQAGRRPSNSESRIAHNTAVHLKLTATAVALGCLVAIPLALLVSRSPGIAGGLQYLASLLQTIPALALLALLIPLLGLGQTTAIFALFLYSLLPIVRNTLAGLGGVDPLLKEVARSLGLTPAQQILRIELPLAVPMIIAGIKTAAIISIGTATLAAFVGAGGLGEPIITGLTLNNNRLILEGAIPAACLAIATEVIFGLIERGFVPAHLRRS
ncbi:glycine betaine ABC transporter substrate-binding protein [Congregibacter sp.]|uniref:glycine betaine ABC transporter substrate-binding protein n=1 Tax=Congregibacter sp. TaxID=2744308 RepID=UPI003857FF30